MRRILLTTLICSVSTAVIAAPAIAAPQVQRMVGWHVGDVSTDAQIWLAKDDKGQKPKHAKNKGSDKGKAHGKKKDHDQKDHDKKAKVEKSDKGDKIKVKGAHSKGDKDFDARVERFIKDRDSTAAALLESRAPKGRDMALLLGAAGLLLAGPDIDVVTLPQDELITYRNCPPGLAKKDPPCVPPGLAKKGVTYDEWARYSDADYDRLLDEQRRPYLDEDRLTDRELLLLDSQQIARLYGLDPAPQGQRYALIDGLPVLLEDNDYSALLRINELARVADIGAGLNVAPTAALTQEELMRLYRLPAPQAGYNYAVLNGQVIALQDSAYETLQLIRVARAVF
tara:strand:+ start:48838 stop:49857 length:1020 start_codon:yes stop_codon:yes gene_type:complete